jgi:glycosyltransferase involved in cell wall biosynthesis
LVKVLFISYDGMTDPLGQSQVIPYLAGLSEKGFQFHILSSEKKDLYRKNKDKISALLKSHHIEWHPTLYSKWPPVLSTLWDLRLLKRKAIRLQRKEGFSIIHCRSYIPSLIGLHIKKKYGPKLIFDMRGFWEDERVDGNLWNTRKFLYKKIYSYFKAKERELLTCADKVVSLTENGKQEMLTWHVPGLSAGKIAVIPCVTDENVFTVKTPGSQRIAKNKLGLQNNEFVLSYIGSLGTWYMLDEMLSFFKILKSQRPDAKFLFLTPDKEEFLFEKAKRSGLNPDDLIIHFCQRDELTSYAHASDLSIFFIKPSFSKKSSSPTKMGELLSMGIPIVANTGVGDVEAVLKQTKSGICVSDFSERTFSKVITEIKNLEILSPEEIRNNSSGYFQLQHGLNAYLSVYNNLS